MTNIVPTVGIEPISLAFWDNVPTIVPLRVPDVTITGPSKAYKRSLAAYQMWQLRDSSGNMSQ